MRRFTLPHSKIYELLEIESTKFPSYIAPLLNLANRYAQGTRPKVVGQLSTLIREFNGKTLEEWRQWYRNQHPDAIQKAVEKIKDHLEKFKQVLDNIDDETINQWVEDLVINKTYVGLRLHEAILKEVAQQLGRECRLAGPDEEAKGIDGYIGNTAVSIKPSSYRQQHNVVEDLPSAVIFYTKTRRGIDVEYDESSIR
jgi:uncharacterized protein YukE